LALWWISVLQAVQGFVLRCTRVAGPVGAVGIDVERRISFGVGIPPRDFTNEDLFSSQMMSMHNSTHSSQMKRGRAGDELAHLVLALATERAVERILGRYCRPCSSQNPDKR
jgi:hypothetical protein